jgi:hypothetical protein
MQKVAKDIDPKSAKDFAETPHAGLPNKKEALEKLREYIRKAVRECMMEIQEDMSQVDSKGVSYSPNGEEMKYEEKEGGEKSDLNNPYEEDSEGTYEKRYSEGQLPLKEQAKTPKEDKQVYKLPPAGNKPGKITDPKAPSKQKSPTEPTAKKQTGFTDPKAPKKPAAYTNPKSTGGNPVEKAIKDPPEKGVDDKFIKAHDTGKKDEEALKSTQNSVCPTCNKPYTEEEKKKKKDE